jgi:hypothetical protein
VNETPFYCDAIDSIVYALADPAWHFSPICGKPLAPPPSLWKREEVNQMSELTTIAATLESQATRLRQIADELHADAAKVETDLGGWAGGTATTTPVEEPVTPVVPAVDPVTAATPAQPSQGEPLPATETNVHASDAPLPSEQAQPTEDAPAA